jgi:3-oxoacyl-[acyl-carrier-protein] synthase-3
MHIATAVSTELSSGMFQITGHGIATPSTLLTNSALADELGIEPNWIQARCGIRSRFVSNGADTTTTLAVAAARRALAKSAGFRPDLLICATFTPDRQLCPNAPAIAQELGWQVAAYDVNAACSGGLVGLVTALAFLASGASSRVLLVASDTTTRYLGTDDAGTRILFGDAAVALLLERGAARGFRVLHWQAGSDGSGASLFYLRGAGCESGAPSPATVHMDGPALFRFAVECCSRALHETCLGAGIPDTEVSCVVLHQANLRIIRALQQRFSIPEDRWIVNIDRFGNTAGASVLLALVEALETRVHPGDHVLVAAFGGRSDLGLYDASVLSPRTVRRRRYNIPWRMALVTASDFECASSRE